MSATEIDTSDVIIVTESIGGWMAVQLMFTEEDWGSYWEPWATGFGRYATKEEAIVEARQWAEAEEIRLSADLQTPVEPERIFHVQV